MNAIEFIKQNGVARCTELVNEVSKSKKLEWYIPQIDINLDVHESGFSFDDLKQIVDAFWLVKIYGGLEESKNVLFLVDNGIFIEDKNNSCIFSVDQLKQAVKLVEKFNER